MQKIDSLVANDNGTIKPRGGSPIWIRRGYSSEILNVNPKGDHPDETQAFCDP